MAAGSEEEAEEGEEDLFTGQAEGGKVSPVVVVVAEDLGIVDMVRCNGRAID